MDGKRFQQPVDDRIILPKSDIRALIRVLEAFAQGGIHEIRYGHYPAVSPEKMKLCICDMLIKSWYDAAAGVNQYYLDREKDNAGNPLPVNVLRGNSFTICNQGEKRIKVTFFDDNLFGNWQNVSKEIQLLADENHAPSVEIHAGGCETVETIDEKGDHLDAWINIEEVTDSGWRNAKGGGNGPEMGFDDP